jgi:hypothetical protein
MTGNVPATTLDDVNVTAPATTPATTPQFNPYAQRQIQLTFQLNAANGSFSGGGNTLTLTGLRTFVQIQKATLPTTGQLYLRVQGMTLDHVNKLTKAGTTFQQSNNTVSVAAGDVGGQLTTVFTGDIIYAYPDFSTQPDVAFIVQSTSTAIVQLKPSTPVTFTGSTTAQQALTQILQPTGIKLQNNGVNATLASPYFPGTAWQQVMRCVRAANCDAAHDDLKNALVIAPKTGGTSSGATVVISPQTGMIGYPEFQQTQIRVRTLFAPNTLVGPLQQIQVQSQLTSANGKWNAYEVTYNLSSEAPGGPWEMIISGAPVTLTGSGGAS